MHQMQKLFKLTSATFQKLNLPLNPLKPQNLTHTNRYSISFFPNFFNGGPKKKTKKPFTRSLLLSKASKAFDQGFFKGPDFWAVEQSLAFREVNRLHQKAQELRRSGNYYQALAHYKIVLSVIKDYYDEDDPLLAFYYKKIADIYLEKEDYQKAIENFTLGLEVMIEAFGEEDLRVAKSYLLIGKYQMKERKYAEAVQSLYEALEIYSKSPESCKGAISSCHFKLAESFLYIGRYDEALENFEKLLDINKPETENTFLSQSYENFAIALAYAKHKYDEALLYLQQVLNKEMLLNGGSSLSSGNCYLKIGQINTMQGRYQEAMEAYTKALEISKLIGGTNHRQTGSCYNAIGAVFLGQGKYNEALEYFKLALNCFEEKDFEIYACYKNIAMTCFKQNRYDTALTNFEYSIEERSKLLVWFSQVDAECAILHGFLASLYMKNQNYTGSLEHYEQFLEIVFKLICAEAWRSLKKEENRKSTTTANA